MIRLGIVGSDNSHALAFSELCNVRAAGDPLRITGAAVVAICGDDAERTREVAEKGLIPRIVALPEEMIGDIDAALVVHRHGGRHLAAARPFLERGLPVFVDKPLAAEVAEAEEIAGLARRFGAPLTSFTTLRWSPSFREFAGSLSACGEIVAASVAGPGDPDSPFAGLFFYGIHSVELMLAAFGSGVRRVRTTQLGKQCLAAVEYDDKLVSLQLFSSAASTWHLAAFGRDGHRSVDVDAQDCYYFGLRAVTDMVESRRPPLSDQELLEPVRVLASIERSRATGDSVDI
jgi:predicted dehydrogenase